MNLSPFPPVPLAEQILDLKCTIARVDAEIATFAGWATVARGFHARGLMTAEGLAASLATWAKGSATSEMVAGRLRAELDALQTALAAEEREALARDIVAAPRFEWCSGMRYLTEGRAYRLADDDFFGKIVFPPDHIPDLADARTLSALRWIAKVSREASPAEILAALQVAP
jgi:hypothetical protein